MSESLQNFTIDFEPVGKRVATGGSETLLTAAQKAGIDLVALCGGAGRCGACRVRLIEGELTPPTLVEKEELSESDLKNGIRLACQAYTRSRVKIHIPPESLTTPQRLQVEGGEVPVVDEPVVHVVDIDVPQPDLYDLRSDAFRVREALPPPANKSLIINSRLLGDLSDQLREQDWRVSIALRGVEMVGVFPYRTRGFGLAVDIGTTKIAAFLLDLEKGKTLAQKGLMNPQIRYGEDVISRISYTENNISGRHILQECLVEALNDLVKELCQEAGIHPEQIVEVVAVGNTAIMHFFAGLSVKQLAMSPYVPSVNKSLDLPARDLGLKLSPGIYVYLPPNIGGFVGADHVAMLLATGTYQTKETVLALDIGTNTEISLAHNGKLICCSCASGPAFEGAHIQNGIRAVDGAIERVQILDGEVHFHTINNKPAVGLCGSGILDAVAALRKNGIVDQRGLFVKNHPQVRVDGKRKEFVLVDREHSGTGEDIVITQHDINEILLAKSAIRTGIEVLLETAGLKPEDIQKFVVAGAFGTYLDLDSAIRIKMFPDLPRERFKQVGNAAGLGARMMLVSSPYRAAALQFALEMSYVELITQPRFKEIFIESMYL
jgi:uncharacterized 2Fe-2S/4Fe-4S cluster protein (DUF4445 family)